MWAKLCRRSAMLFTLVAGMLAASLSVVGQDKKKEEPKEDPVVEIPFKDTEVGINTFAMMACFGSGSPNNPNPWSLIGARLLASKEAVPLPAWHFDFREVPRLDQAWLDRTRDGRPLPKILHQDLKQLGPDLGFYLTFNKAVEQAHAASLDQFKVSAEEYEHVRYQALRATPGRYRGKVITVTGKLTVIRKEDTPRLAAAKIGKELPFIYTGWVMTEPAKKLPPYTVVFTQLPPEIPKENERLDLDVTFHGYFIAFVSFPTGKEVKGKPQEMFSPYLVGKTLTLNPPQEKKEAIVPVVPEEKDTTPISARLIAWTVGGIVVVALLVGILNVWLRQGDRRIQSQLAAVRDRHRPFNIEPAEETPPPPLATPIAEVKPEDGGKPAEPSS